MARIQRNTINTFALVAFCFVACWIANQVLFMAYNLGITLNVPSSFRIFADAAITVNTCVNPLIYAFRYETFQTRVKTFFRSIFGIKSQKSETGNV